MIAPYRRSSIRRGLVYGLVNICTDGERVLCATLDERGNDFDVKTFQAGVDA